MLDFLSRLFDTTDFMPRWYCGNWSAGHGWLHVVSDLGVWSAYVAIPCVLGWFVLRRSDLPFRTVFWLFSAFILACGSTHLMEAALFWWPAYRLAGVIKLFTAIISWATVIALIPVIPQALRLRTPEDLEREIVERKKAEAALMVSRDELEKKVQERVAELATANKTLELEIVDRKKAQEQAEIANRMKDEFLATLSHELRTPLTAIVGWSALLRMGAKDNRVDLLQGLDVIERNAAVQTHIIDDLLDVSRIISGNLRLDVQQVNLVEVIDQSLAAITPAMEAKHVQLQRILDPSAGTVMGDPSRLQQVIWNLLSNAVKFTPSRGKIQIRLQRVKSLIEISVTDTGEGISAEFLPFVFDRFRQNDASTTRRHGGLGLGLSIVRKLVELHGGTVSVNSPGEGQGSMFVVLLPITAVKSDSASHIHPQTSFESDAGAVFNDLAGVHVLVVDDEPDARDLIKRVLTQCKAHVETAGSVSEAVELLKRYRPHVLLSDIGMPDQDGYDLIRQVRTDHTPREIPAVALTAFARTEDRRRALQSGFQMHIAKPVDPGELTAAVANLAGLSRTGPS